VLKAVDNVITELGPEIIGMDALDQTSVDQALLELDGTPTKSKLGANAILGVSMATARAASEALGLPLWRYLGGAQARVLPAPMMNIINGGAHADNGLEIQEFMIYPVGFDSFGEALRAGAETFHTLKKLLSDAGEATSVGDEGGFAPRLKTNEEALAFVAKAIEKAGYKLGEQIAIALDCAASEFHDKGVYTFDGKQVDAGKLVEIYAQYCEKFPHRPSRTAWTRTTGTAGRPSRSASARARSWWATTSSSPTWSACSAASTRASPTPSSIKVNQIGSITETLEHHRLGARTATRRSSRTAAARPRTRSSRTSRSPPGRADQDGLGLALGAHRQVQPAAPHRRAAGRGRGLRGPLVVLGLEPGGLLEGLGVHHDGVLDVRHRVARQEAETHAAQHAPVEQLGHQHGAAPGGAAQDAERHGGRARHVVDATQLLSMARMMASSASNSCMNWKRGSKPMTSATRSSPRKLASVPRLLGPRK
jgi:hypothetical protein